MSFARTNSQASMLSEISISQVSQQHNNIHEYFGFNVKLLDIANADGNFIFLKDKKYRIEQWLSLNSQNYDVIHIVHRGVE